MARTPSTMLELGTSAPDFSLPDVNGAQVSLNDFANKPLLVVFSCNHCPFVLHVLEPLVSVAKSYQSRGVEVVMINANDVDNYPDDSPDKMRQLSQQYAFSFPYLFDETQAVAKAYEAACTPDLFLFDQSHRLFYRGQFDDARPGNAEPVDGHDLRNAIDTLLAGEPAPTEQKPSLGCNIKWKPGQAPEYFG